MPDPTKTRCPICGRDNTCGQEQGASQCWCFEIEIAPEVLDRIPEEAKGVACLCRDCAEGRVPSPCIGTCLLDESGQTCRGCYRTIDEIRDWWTLADEQKLEIHARLRALRSDS